MLKTILQSKDCINNKEYTKLMAFLKRQSDGYNVEKFINEAPDEKYLATKVPLIFGVTRACRRQKLYEITTNDIEDHGDMLFIKIPHTKNKIPRSFVVPTWKILQNSKEVGKVYVLKKQTATDFIKNSGTVNVHLRLLVETSLETCRNMA